MTISVCSYTSNSAVVEDKVSLVSQEYQPLFRRTQLDVVYFWIWFSPQRTWKSEDLASDQRNRQESLRVWGNCRTEYIHINAAASGAETCWVGTEEQSGHNLQDHARNDLYSTNIYWLVTYLSSEWVFTFMLFLLYYCLYVNVYNVGMTINPTWSY